jgi:hypothetical protein
VVTGAPSATHGAHIRFAPAPAVRSRAGGANTQV